MQVVRSSGHDQMMARHFQGQDDEVEWATRGIPARDLPAVKTPTDLSVVQGYIKDYPTVVMGVEEIRLFDGDNHEAVRFRFPGRFYFTREEEERGIRRGHAQRLKVIQTITAPEFTLTTVSFIPGEVDHVEYGMHVLEECWQTELSEFCATLLKNPHIQYVHIAAKLCASWQLNVDQLLSSSLVELSLPDLKVPQGWRDLAAGLARNQTLRVLTVRWSADGMETFLQTRLSRPNSSSNSEVNWTECNSTLETLWISCPKDLDLQADAEPVASVLHRVYCVKSFVIEYSPPEPTPDLLRFASILRQALLVAPNVRELQLLIPFRGLELTEHILKAPLEIRTLTELVLVPDRWTRADLEAVGAMVRENKALRFFGVRHQNPKRKQSFWRCMEKIRETDMVEFLNRVAESSSLQTLSLQRWGLVDGRRVLAAVIQLHKKRPQLDVDLTGTGLALRNMLEPVVALLQQLKRLAKVNNHDRVQPINPSSMYMSASPSSLYPSPPASQAGGSGGVYMKSVTGATSSTGSPRFTKGSTISEHGEFDTGSGPGSVWTPATTTVEQQQAGRGRSLPRSFSSSSGSTPMFFSSFSYDQVVEATKKFHTVLGEGGFGKVYEGELVDSGKKVAVKDLKVETLNGGSGDLQRIEKSFEAEVKTLGLIHHVNLVRLLGFCTQNGHHMLIYEFMPNSSLERWIFNDDPLRAKLDWEQRKVIAVGVARGLEYLHVGCEQPIIHLDVKPQNILLDAHLNPKLADFGIAKLVNMEENLAIVTQAQGTRCYMAPEIHQLGVVTTKSDVYSYGLLLMELIRGKKNINGDENSQRFFPSWARNKFHTGRYMDVYRELTAPLLSPIIPGYQTEEARRMLCIVIACIHEEMESRPDMKTVLLMLEGRMDVPDPSGNRNFVHYDFRNY